MTSPSKLFSWRCFCLSITQLTWMRNTLIRLRHVLLSWIDQFGNGVKWPCLVTSDKTAGVPSRKIRGEVTKNRLVWAEKKMNKVVVVCYLLLILLQSVITIHIYHVKSQHHYIFIRFDFRRISKICDFQYFLRLQFQITQKDLIHPSN